MDVEQKVWSKSHQWESISSFQGTHSAQLVLAFGDRLVLEDPERYEEIQRMYPEAHILMASSSGDILDNKILDNQISLAAIYFEKTKIKPVFFNVEDFSVFFECGEKIALELQSPDLTHIFVISDGQKVNGSVLVKGICSQIQPTCQITGGMAGDGNRFEKTLVGLDTPPKSGGIAAIGFYGSHIRIGYGSVGGWIAFGPKRKVTRSKGNKLYEIDNEPALDLYKKYLGEQAEKLPGAALLFPLSIHLPMSKEPLIRSILSINDEEKSLTFAGNIPEGCIVQLMQADYEQLIEAAGEAASSCSKMLGNQEPQLAILVSCAGRRFALGQRTEEELDCVQKTFGKQTCLMGFYSYGEIAPMASDESCELHNETMTITSIREE